MQCLSSKPHYMIVVAGGKGIRLGNSIPKQFLPIKGKPILMRTLEKIKSADENIKIVLVLPKEHQDYWLLLCHEYSFKLEHKIVDGGEERFYSVKNGLDAIKEDSIIGVHDGVRPFVSIDVILDCFRVAEEKNNAIPCINPVETVRIGSETKNRDEVWLVQTPQCFESDILKEVYSQNFDKKFTDDASVVENLGYKINLVQGNRENIKITNPLDLSFAEILIDEYKD